ncbi:RNA pseudouridine synthase [Acetobacter sp. AN02]|uniref:RluA family pseudouridine synthase n=1 Tax=Acetobacter sp. AN02 TaxID=2894186 RepID=UPI0024341787|nr:RNA pseudouridine synthase [Acetobacter sp. AN02]MDG6093546.1 RNA pseudouridine synthase [Acetobacter sp. AN02]
MRPPPARAVPPAVHKLPFTVLYETNRFLVIDKPAGLPVYPSRAGGPSVEDWFPLMSRRKDGPWLVHRLDQDTSGCLMIALRKQALLDLQEQLRTDGIRKIYHVVVRGRPEAESGDISFPLKRTEQGRFWRMSVAQDGQPSLTRWHLRGYSPERNLAWLEVELLTGRTHQIRAHCAASGWPVLGDTVYGEQKQDVPLHLLARRLILPETDISAPVPEHMKTALSACGLTSPETQNGA